MNYNGVRRGYVPTDERDFSEKAYPALLTALSDIQELLNRGYPLKSAAVFVGNRYQLSERQRLALSRAAASRKDIIMRKDKLVSGNVKGRLNIDGLNIIITLESAVSGTTLYRCQDGTVRDLAAMRGAYRIIDATYIAAGLVLDEIAAVKAEGADFFLDAPVSNTGRLKTILLDEAQKRGIDISCELVKNADVVLYGRENVVTSDAIILNECISWVNMAANIIGKSLDGTKIIDLQQSGENV